jgi:hypothetical protein
MRRALLIAGAVALTASIPASGKPGGGGDKPEKHHGVGHGGGGHGGGGKPEKQHGGGGGGRHHAGGGWGGKPDKAEHRGGGGRFERQSFREHRKAERAFAREERRRDWGGKPEKADRKWARAERKAEKRDFAKAEKKAGKADAKREERFVRAERRQDLRRVRYEDRRLDDPGRRLEDRRYEDSRSRYEDRYGGERYASNCPPGLARKNNGCLPPGQAKKMFAVGQALPVAYYSSYNVPYEYRDWYQDTPDYQYRYDDSGYIYGVDSQSGLIESLIPLLGGGFGIGEVLPAGYDTYNLPMSYRDDFQDSDEALYRYGDDAIYQVDPQSQMIEAVVALLGGDLNVGQQLPSGYDTYNLPMEYRDQYQDSDESMYRYADGNIFEIDPKSMIIEQIVAQLT